VEGRRFRFDTHKVKWPCQPYDHCKHFDDVSDRETAEAASYLHIPDYCVLTGHVQA